MALKIASPYHGLKECTCSFEAHYTLGLPGRALEQLALEQLNLL